MSKRTSIITLVALIVVTALFAYLGINGMPLGRFDFLPFSRSISMGLDLKGGVFAVYQAKDETQADLDNKINLAMSIMRRRLDSKGFTEATLSVQKTLAGKPRIRVEVPDVTDVQALYDLIGTPAHLQFKDPDMKVVMEGMHVKTAQANMQNGAWVVDFTLDSVGATQFSEATSRLVGQPLYIYLDDEEVTHPTVNTAITGGSGYIEGNFTQGSAEQLATQLQSGALPLEITRMEAQSISATLGVDAMRSSLEADAIGLVAVILFMILFYRLPGFLSCISLVVHTLLLLYALALFGIQLTLPGVAGIILGIGMSVDANVIIFARIRDEMVTGKTLRSAVDGGFKKAFITIFDSNMTNIIAGCVLWALGTGPIKGFAYTMLLGVILSMFTAITLTRLLMNIMIKLNITSPWLYSHRWQKEEVAK